MYYYNPEEREAKELVPGINAKTFWGEKMLAAVVDLDANVQLPRHSHPHEQMGYIFSGQVDITIDGQERRLGPGDAYYVP